MRKKCETLSVKVNLLPEHFVDKARESKHQEQASGNCIEFPALWRGFTQRGEFRVLGYRAHEEVQHDQFQQAPTQMLAMAVLRRKLDRNDVKQLIGKPR